MRYTFPTFFLEGLPLGLPEGAFFALGVDEVPLGGRPLPLFTGEVDDAVI